DYARALPWAHQAGTAEAPELRAAAGPDAVVLRGGALRAHGHAHFGTIEVAAGEASALSLTWHPSFLPVPEPLDLSRAAAETAAWWKDWAARIRHEGPHEAEVRRSLLILRALTNRDTGGIAAAATT